MWCFLGYVAPVGSFFFKGKELGIMDDGGWPRLRAKGWDSC